MRTANCCVTGISQSQAIGVVFLDNDTYGFIDEEHTSKTSWCEHGDGCTAFSEDRYGHMLPNHTDK